MKKYLILLLVITNLALGVQSFSAMTKEEKIKLEKQIDDAYGKNDKKKLETLIIKYVTEFPNNADYLNRLAVLYTNQKNYSEAEKWYLKAIEKGNFTAISNIAYLYFEKKDYEKSIKYYKEYQKLVDNPDNYLWIAAAYYEMDDYKNAKEWYLKVAKFEKDGFSENKLGVMFEEEGNQKEALKWYQASVQKGYPWAYYNLTNFYAGLGDSETAEKWAKKGMEISKKADDSELKKYLQEALDVIQKAK